MTTIEASVTRHRSVPRPPAPFVVHGISLAPSGGAMVSARWVEGFPTVYDLRQFPARLAPLGAAVSAIPREETFIIDGGLHGLDLWAYLGARSSRRGRLFEVARPELRRAELAGRLRAAAEHQSFAIARSLFGLGTEAALRAALRNANREDAADRPEVSALSLAVVNRRPPPPRIG